MPRVTTAGTCSCATIAIGGFKIGNSRTQNEEYKKTRKFPLNGLQEVEKFFSNVLYPVQQPLGWSEHLPFEYLMESIDKSRLKTKMITVVLNSRLISANKRYWPNELKRWGFEEVAQTVNSIGGNINVLFIRNPNKPKNPLKVFGEEEQTSSFVKPQDVVTTTDDLLTPAE